jgi:2-methylcitrate dehydratase PrpD
MFQVWTTDALAEWCTSLELAEMPEAVIAKAEDCLLDVIACAIAGRDAEATARVAGVASAQYRDGPAHVWFGAERLHPTGAAFVNSTAASILDLDDGHRGPCGHPGAAVIPTALAVAQETNAGGDALLGAIIAGYEVCTRIGASEHRIAYHTGNWSGFGAAAAAARLRGLGAGHLAHALAITAYHGPRIADLTLSADMGSNVKESLPWSVVVGLNAADLASKGFSGCRDALDIDERFKPGHATSGLGESFQIMRTYFKRYSACRWVHAAVEALLRMMDEHGLAANDIESVHVETFRQAANLNNLADPPSTESAQYSLPFCLGLAATKGEEALMPMAANDLHDPATVAFANKVTVVCDEDLAAGYPDTVPSRVTLNTRSGPFEVLIERPWGEPDGAVGRADLIGKFRALAAGRISDHRANAIIAAVENLRNGPIEPLIQLLGAPMDALRETAHG